MVSSEPNRDILIKAGEKIIDHNLEIGDKFKVN
jgi:hypothetical protein